MHETGLDPAAKPVLALAADLLFASRIRAAAQSAGVELRLVRSVDQALESARAGARHLILDLDLRAGDAVALIEAIRADPATADLEVTGFVSHVNEDRIRAARAAGATRVLARSAFVRDLPRLLGA